MREDDCPISRGHAADNLACFRHVPLNQIRREKTIKASVNRKQKMATMSEEVLDLIVNDKSKSPEFDTSRGEFKRHSYQTTALGRLLLRSIGLISEA